MKIFNLLIAQEFEQAGSKKTRWHNVGKMGEFQEGGGYWLELPPGLSIAGRLIAKPRRLKGSNDNQPKEQAGNPEK